METKSLFNYSTTVDMEKIPKKKLNYKQLLYKRRLKYGRYINLGITIDKIKFRIKDGKLVYELDSSIDKKEEEELLKDNFYKSLFYCSDLDFNTMPSKREIKLRYLLKEKIKRLRELTSKKEDIVDNNKDNNS